MITITFSKKTLVLILFAIASIIGFSFRTFSAVSEDPEKTGIDQVKPYVINYNRFNSSGIMGGKLTNAAISSLYWSSLIGDDDVYYYFGRTSADDMGENFVIFMNNPGDNLENLKKEPVFYSKNHLCPSNCNMTIQNYLK